MAAGKASSGHVDQATLEPPAKKIKRTKEPMASGGASSSLGACQPGTTPPATALVEFRVVSFNFGIKQAMIGLPTMRGTLYAGYKLLLELRAHMRHDRTERASGPLVRV